MRYQIYEAKSVKYDAQQRVGISAENAENQSLPFEGRLFGSPIGGAGTAPAVTEGRKSFRPPIVILRRVGACPPPPTYRPKIGWILAQGMFRYQTGRKNLSSQTVGAGLTLPNGPFYRKFWRSVIARWREWYNRGYFADLSTIFFNLVESRNARASFTASGIR